MKKCSARIREEMRVLANLTGRSALVTGGTRGIGFSVAETLLTCGASVVLSGRDSTRVTEAVDKLRPHGPVAGIIGDVSSAADCAAMATHPLLRNGLDIVVANAGIYPPADLGSITDAAMSEMFDVNIKGTINTVQACLAQLRASAFGRVIVISSITGPTTGLPGWSHYAASKAAQVGFVRTAALELAGDGVTVNAVLPGNTRTEGLEELGADYIARMTQSIPLGRLVEPQDIAHAVVFLASDYASFITGQTLTVDGGQVLPEASLGSGR